MNVELIRRDCLETVSHTAFCCSDEKGVVFRILIVLLSLTVVRGNWGIPKKSRVSKNAISLISGMLQRKPTERLGCLAGGYRDIKNHPWMQEVNFVKLVKKQIKVRFCGLPRLFPP